MSETKTQSNLHIAYDDPTTTSQVGPSFHEAVIDTMILSPPSRRRQTLRFLRHFGEMILAMLLGMVVFDAVSGTILIPMGFTYLSSSPEVLILSMAVAMTVPMVVWMRLRKHSWRLNAEMAGAMIVPTIFLIALCMLGLLPRASLMLGAHVLMVPAMLAVMLYRWPDYMCH